MKRRKFSKIALLGSSWFYLPKLVLAQEPSGYPFKTLNEAFRALEFNPESEGSSFFTVTADVHYGSDGDGMMNTINDVNTMSPKPAFLCVNGDMIVHASTHFGVIPDAKDSQKAITEFRQFKGDADKLDKNIPLKLTLGNHDTHPGEIEPKLFWEVFPEHPAYQSMDLDGLLCIFLNGHSTGYIDSEQMKWLENEVKNISETQHVIIFIHQPSMSRRVRERGIPAAISKAFEDHKGRVWLIGGHEHTNSQKIFKLKHTELIEHGITCGTAKIWGGPEKPGYWVYCLKNGQVVGRIFKQRTLGYRNEPEPEVNHSKPIPMPFDNCSGLEWKLLVGENNSKFLVESDAEDCLNYWAYVKTLIYSLPFEETKNNVTKIAMLAEHKSENTNKPNQYFISLDKKNWEEIPLSKANEDLLLFNIPTKFQKEHMVYFKFVPDGEAAVAGFALLN